MNLIRNFNILQKHRLFSVFAKRAQAVSIVMTVFVLSLSACSPASTPASVSPTVKNNLAVVQQNGNLSARFYGLMTFDYSGSPVKVLSELAVSGVPVEWMGALFSGKLEEFGPGEDVTDEVHGSLSADGNWVESLFFSRQILRTSANASGTFYRVTLKNIHLVIVDAGTQAGQAAFEKTGSDIRKYVITVEYADGPVKDGKIVSKTTYTSTDWENIKAGQTPTLKMSFSKGSGNKGVTAPAKPGMGMSQPQ
jgi:hypothetical protein